jgi:hypothetical protein
VRHSSSQPEGRGVGHMKVLLTGRTRAVIDEVVAALRDLDVRFFAANTVEEVDGVLGRADLDHVILGGGLDLDSRLLIVRRVCEASDSTTVHMNSQSGPETDLPFVRSVLYGFLSG